MTTVTDIDAFLSNYDKDVHSHALKLRTLLLANLPGITELVDIPAKMIAYTYGPKYADLICVIIPSKKGLKLGFNRGAALPDPDNLLEGTGKISRYVQIKNVEQIHTPAIKNLLNHALTLYKQSVNA